MTNSVGRPNLRRLSVFSDASINTGVGAYSSVAVMDNLVVEQNAVAYLADGDDSNEAEMLGLINSAMLAVRVVKRLKITNSVVRVLCDNQHSIYKAAYESRLDAPLEELRQHGVSVLITYVGGEHVHHQLCHATCNLYRKRKLIELEAEQSAKVVENPSQRQQNLRSAAAAFAKVGGAKGAANDGASRKGAGVAKKVRHTQQRVARRNVKK